MSMLSQKTCKSCESGQGALSPQEVATLLAAVPGWTDDGGRLTRTFPFKNYYETIAFVNAIAWISHQQDHHPDLEVGYNRLVVHYSTHSVGGLSENDFICAAKVSALAWS